MVVMVVMVAMVMMAVPALRDLQVPQDQQDLPAQQVQQDLRDQQDQEDLQDHKVLLVQVSHLKVVLQQTGIFLPVLHLLMVMHISYKLMIVFMYMMVQLL
jgi:hypothetical protein